MTMTETLQNPATAERLVERCEARNAALTLDLATGEVITGRERECDQPAQWLVLVSYTCGEKRTWLWCATHDRFMAASGGAWCRAHRSIRDRGEVITRVAIGGAP